MSTKPTEPAAPDIAPIDEQRHGVLKTDQTDAKEAKAARLAEFNNGDPDLEPGPQRPASSPIPKG